MADRQLVQSEQINGVTVLGFGGSLKNINEDLIPSIAEQLLAAVQQEQAGADPGRAVIMDLEGVEFFGSSFIEVLFRLWNQVKARGGQFCLSSVATYCTEILTVTNLHRLWTIYPSRDAALAAMQPPS